MNEFENNLQDKEQIYSREIFISVLYIQNFNVKKLKLKNLWVAFQIEGLTKFFDSVCYTFYTLLTSLYKIHTALVTRMH